MSIRPAVILLLASLLGLPCLAKDAKVGQTSVTLTAPSGQCELDPGQPSDARMLQITESTLAGVGNRLLGFYADCAPCRLRARAAARRHDPGSERAAAAARPTTPWHLYGTLKFGQFS